MASGFNFELEGLDAIFTSLDATLNEIDDRVDEVLQNLALKVIHDAKKLAPLDHGDLEAALTVGEVKQLIGVSYIDFGTTPDVDAYAVIQHEGFYRDAKGAIKPMEPGEKTLSKGAYNGEMPGAKFLERAIKMNEKLIIEELSKVLGGR
ncbi:hypothetical protein [Paenibacillus sp. NPDC057934]|uniref:hypothetical protein n=1 Tax=Paenibacillus sp. NPDC057934 TaxID=3346282 RepID=UPI0036DCAF15